jgi:uncharacterized membrane protein YqjE
MTAPTPPLRRIAGSLYGLAHARLELFGLELADEKDRLLGILLTGMIAIAFGAMAAICLTGLVAVIFWNSYRWESLAVLMVLYGIGAMTFAIKARATVRRTPAPFEATLAELDKDRAMIGAIVSPDTAQ